MKNRIKKALGIFLALLFVISCTAGCNNGSANVSGQNSSGSNAQTQEPSSGGQSAEPAQPKEVDILRFGIGPWPTSLDPGSSVGNDTAPFFPQFFDNLLYATNDGKIESYVCESWEYVDDTAVVTEYKLKDGIFFHNGDQLTSADIKFTIERLLQGDVSYFSTNARSIISTIERVEIVDPLTFRIITSAPDPVIFSRLAAQLGVYIVPQKYMEAVGVEAFGQKPIGTGPYRVDSFGPEKITMSYFEGYTGKKPLAKAIEYVRFAEPTAMATAMITGEINFAWLITPDIADMLSGYDNIIVDAGNYSSSHLMRFNTATMDKPLRQALSLAIDRELICETLWAGYASVPLGYNYEEFGEYYVADYPGYRYDPEKAKALLAQSSYNGETITLQLVPGYYALGVEVGEAVVDMWNQIGVKAEVKFVEKNNTNSQEYAANWANGIRFSDPIGGLWLLWGEGTSIQKDIWRDVPAEFNELGARIAGELDPKARYEINRRMIEIWDEEVPGTLVYSAKRIWATSDFLEWDYVPGRLISMRAEQLSFR